MKIDLEKFLAATMLLSTAATPACGGADSKKVETKAESKTAAPTAPPTASPPQPTPPPLTNPTPTPAEPAQPTDDKSAGPGGAGGKAKVDPGPEEEKPSW
jgi:hypothetical protein